jgi:ELWxxDGT repeat protein
MKKLPIILLLLCCHPSFAQVQLIKDIYTGSSSSDPLHLTVFNNKLYFNALENVHGRELWNCDSAGQTNIVKDLFAGTQSGAVYQNYSARNVVLAGQLYFVGNDGAHGYELYRCDSNNAITLAADVNAGALSSLPNALTVLNDKLYFFASTAADGYELYEFDPATNAAAKKSNIAAGPKNAITDNENAMICAFNNKVYFTAGDSVHGQELYAYDPATQVTAIVYDFTNDTASGGPANFLAVGGKLYMSARTAAYGRELYVYDGITTPQRITDVRLNAGDGVYNTDLAFFNNKIVFAGTNGGYGYEPWCLDTATYAVNMIADLYAGSPSSGPEFFYVHHNKLYFAANDVTAGCELWCWDGTTDPKLLADIWAGPDYSVPLNFTTWNGFLYFNAGSLQTGYELYRLDDIHMNIENLGSGPVLTVYPNPTPGVVHFNMAQAKMKGTIMIRDVNGKTCYRQPVNTEYQTEWTVDMSGYNAGVYFYQLINARGVLIYSGKIEKTL